MLLVLGHVRYIECLDAVLLKSKLHKDVVNNSYLRVFRLLPFEILLQFQNECTQCLRQDKFALLLLHQKNDCP